MEISEAHSSARRVARTTRETPPRRSTAAEVAAALGAFRAAEGQWMARCPSHDDRTPSLSIGTGRDGRVLVHCFAGCSADRIIDDLENRHGLAIRLRKSGGGSRPTAAKAGKPSPRRSPAKPPVAESASTPPPGDAPQRDVADDNGDGDDAFVPLPAPEEASPDELMHGGPGRFAAAYRYETGAGDLAGYVRRFDFIGKNGEAAKAFLPLRYGRWRGCTGWWTKGWTGEGSAPLFRLRQLLANPTAPALVAEGEKAAMAAAGLFEDFVAISPMNGAQAPRRTDWGPVSGRDVVVWPDHDAPGAKFAAQVAELATSAGAASVRIVQVPHNYPPKWDLADLPPEGADLRALLTAAEPWTSPKAEGAGGYPPAERRPCFRVYDKPTSFGGVMERAGVYWHEKRGSDDRVELIDTWVCGPLHVEAQTCDETGNHFGRVLRFRNSANVWREWAMPQQMLAGEMTELRGELLSMGLLIGVSPKQRALFAEYLQHRVPERRIRCATSVGWCGPAFVLPDEAIGPGGASVVFQTGERAFEEFAVAGDLDDWRHGVVAMAVGNPILILAVSAAFAGPLLQRASQEAGGIHLVGDSSTGKSTALEMARSVWGGPAFKRSWRATANGLESVAALHNDCLLPLDELSECDPREASAVVYMLANGQGKSRANRVGGARIVRRWRTFVLSTGERTLEATLAEAGQRVKAGQEIRLLNVPAQRRYGVFDELHGIDSGRALADAIKTAAAQHYGHAGRAFLQQLTRDDTDLGEALETAKSLPMFATEGMSGQEMRAAGRFALIGIAGELATEYDLTGWPEGAAVEAAAEGLRLWRSYRSKGDAEPAKILQAVADFIDRHGDSRFSDVDGMANPLVRDRAGWWRIGTAGRQYLFSASGLREACKGFDFARVVAVLREKAVIPPPMSDGKSARSEWVPGDTDAEPKRRARTYNVDVAKLEELIDVA